MANFFVSLIVIHDLPPFYSILLNQKLKSANIGTTHSKGNNIIAQSVVNRDIHIKRLQCCQRIRTLQHTRRFATGYLNRIRLSLLRLFAVSV